MISVRQDQHGLVIIDLTKEPAFDLSTDGVELTSGLFVREIRPQAILVEDVGQLGPVLSYIRDLLLGKGYEVALDPALDRLLGLFQEEQTLAEAIRKGNVKQSPIQSPLKYGIKRALLKHQQDGVKHALTVRHAANFSVPGSGKTAIALSVYAFLRHHALVDRILVIGPASSFAPWEEEFRLTFDREAMIVRLIGTRAQRAESLRHLEHIDLILCTYHMAHRERENLSRILREARYFLVLDESHHIKNIDLGPWARTAIELAPLAERRMILTGTPVPHSLLDLWAQFKFLWPSEAVLGNRAGFVQRLEGSARPVEELKQHLLPFFKRTKKSNLGLPSPASHFIKISYKDIPKRQRLIIRLLELRTLQEAKALGLSKPDVAILRGWRRARAIRLLQAASNPALLSTMAMDLGNPGDTFDTEPALAALLEDYLRNETPAKIEFVVKMVRRLVKGGEKVVVWATFVDNLRLLETLLDDLNPLMVYGGLPAYEEDADPDFENRERNIREFRTNTNRLVLLANPAACSESVSLHTVCHHAVYLERTFNCGQFLQSMDRIHRVGMPSNVRPQYHIPLLDCVIERAVDCRLRERQQTLYNLLNDDMPVIGYEDETSLLDREDDLEAIFRELLKEISTSASKHVGRATGRSRSPR